VKIGLILYSNTGNTLLVSEELQRELIVAAPVRGYALDPAMRVYLDQMPEITGKSVACLITHAFPFAAMGGRQAVSQMTQICEAKGGHVIGSGIVNWSGRDRSGQIKRVIGQMGELFSNIC
jgi:hypothetical protein